MKRTIAVFMALVAAAAGADDWTSGDKRAHFVGGAVIFAANWLNIHSDANDRKVAP